VKAARPEGPMWVSFLWRAERSAARGMRRARLHQLGPRDDVLAEKVDLGTF